MRLLIRLCSFFSSYSRGSSLSVLSFVWWKAFIIFSVQGWIGVRRESRIGFAIFLLNSPIIVGISTSMFSSNCEHWSSVTFILPNSLLSVYRRIFSTRTFFATITITALIFLIETTVLGIICRLNFGQGLAHYCKLVVFLRLDLKSILRTLQFMSAKRWRRSTLHRLTSIPSILAIIAAIPRNLFTMTQKQQEISTSPCQFQYIRPSKPFRSETSETNPSSEGTRSTLTMIGSQSNFPPRHHSTRSWLL